MGICIPCACNRLRKQQKDLKCIKRDAEAASAVYDDELPPGSNLRPATDAELADFALDKNYMENLNVKGAKTGFRARMYVDKTTGEKLIAFRGTTSDDGDIKADVQQAVGMENAYYTRAQEIAARVKMGGGDNVRFVGHSLGGGLASAASRASGNPATTFNAAGLNPLTILRGDEMHLGSDIDAVYVQGEVLTSVQQSLPLPEASATRSIPLPPPKNFGSELLAKLKDWRIWDATKALLMRRLDLHRMVNVQKSIDDAVERNANAMDFLGC